MGIKFNPFVGHFDFVGSSGSSSSADNFSIIKVEASENKVIPINQEMVVTQDVIVEGNLMVEGLLTQLPEFDSFGYFWSRIPANKSVTIPQDRLMFYKTPFTVLGTLLVLGDLMEVA